MDFFLRYVNPCLALAVLVICLLAAVGNKDGNFQFFEDAIPTYFLAKGIFCSAALFLLGKLVEQGMPTRLRPPRAEPSKGTAGVSPPEEQSPSASPQDR